MINVLIILAFATIHLREQLGAALLGPTPLGLTLAVWLGPMVAAVGLLMLVAGRARVRLLATGDVGVLVFARAVHSACRAVAVGAQAAGVLVFDGLGIVKQATLGLPGLDDLVAVLPVGLALAAGRWAMFPVDRSLDDAMLLRRLDRGEVVAPSPSRAAFVWRTVRHEQLLVAAPMLLIGAVADLLALVADGLGLQGGAGPAVGEVIAAAAVFMVAPVIVRRVLDTAPLPPGELSDDIGRVLAASGVRVRTVRVWRTGGELVNALALGLLGPGRAILLSDGLVERLPRAALVAAVAHEAGHLRLRHMLWLAAAVIASVLVMGVAASLVAWAMGLRESSTLIVITGVVTLAVTLIALGFVSRRLEWEADAFAVRALERLPMVAETGPAIEESARRTVAVAIMIDTLARVAIYNGVPMGRANWRHGSIRERQARLHELLDAPQRPSPVDRRGGRLRAIILAALVLGVSGAVVVDRLEDAERAASSG